jgi:hypothetical protein
MMIAIFEAPTTPAPAMNTVMLRGTKKYNPAAHDITRTKEASCHPKNIVAMSSAG